MIFHCGFDLYFPDDSDVEHLFMSVLAMNTVGLFEVTKMFYILIDGNHSTTVSICQNPLNCIAQKGDCYYTVTCTSVYLN